MTLDDQILAVLRAAPTPMTAPAIAAELAAGATTLVTAAQVRRRIDAMRAGGIEIVCWSGRAGGYIHPAREDLLFPVSIGSVIADIDRAAYRASLH